MPNKHDNVQNVVRDVNLADFITDIKYLEIFIFGYLKIGGMLTSPVNSPLPWMSSEGRTISTSPVITTKNGTEVFSLLN